jgi:hypothetical protein
VARNEGRSDGQDAQMAIGHALAMAIEGSTLEALALQSVGSAGGPGATGTSSGTGGGGRYSSEPGLAGAGQGTGPTGPGMAAQQLLDHSRRAWAASDRLLLQAGDSGGAPAVQRFHRATLLYVMTLRATGPVSSGRVGGLGAGRTGGALGGIDLTWVAVTNHAVQEALDSMKIQQMIRMAGSSDGPAARALLAHAREMDRESRQALRSVLTTATGLAGRAVTDVTGTRNVDGATRRASGEGRAAGGAGGRASRNPGGVDLDGGPGSLLTLAQQAQQLVQVIHEISGDTGGAPNVDRGDTGIGGAGNRGAGRPSDRPR